MDNPDIVINELNTVTVNIEAENIPTGTTVVLRVIPILNGTVQEITSTPLVGTMANSTATASITFTPGLSQIFASAVFQMCPDPWHQRGALRDYLKWKE